MRETVESIVIAIILAFLFRSFEAEAFVIPTGSMAPTLQGRHIEVQCPECGYWYRTGASCENSDSQMHGLVTTSTCPICRYATTLKRAESPYYRGPADPNHQSFTGDRILVNKFAYQLGEPSRWDVIVFKYPGNAKQNYIKRLVGLPGETIKIWHGDIFVKRDGDADFHIARKPPHKIKAMLQLVDDTDHIARRLQKVGWPPRWQQWSVPEADRTWQVHEDGTRQRFTNDGRKAEVQWLRYRHLVPRWNVDPEDDTREVHDWTLVEQGKLPAGVRRRPGQLIADYYAYNDTIPYPEPFASSYEVQRRLKAQLGLHWVGDLAVEADVEVQSGSGQLLLDLVEGGMHHTCRIDVATGEAQLEIDGGRQSFGPDRPAARRVGRTRLRGPGHYRLRFANVDDQLQLWVDEYVVKFDGPTGFEPKGDREPVWSAQDPGDAEPVGIGTQGAAVQLSRLRVLRDVYYIASRDTPFQSYTDYGGTFDPLEIRDVLEHPRRWKQTTLWRMRRACTFQLDEDQFFPLGDNSPQSSDARYWADKGIEPYVQRRLLTGKALFVYWPHAWNRPIPFWPNFRRMRFIR